MSTGQGRVVPNMSDNANPSPKQRELMMHALGNPKPGKLPCRNYFAADPGSEDDAEFAKLQEIGLAKLYSCPRPESGFPYNCWLVTEKGRKYLNVP